MDIDIEKIYYYDDYCYKIHNNDLCIYKFDIIEKSYFEIHSFKLKSIPKRYKYIFQYINDCDNKRLFI